MEDRTIMPEMSITFRDKTSGVLGYLVVDTLIDGRCWGGVRISSEVSEKEMQLIARTMSLKYGFLGFKIGGAKAGILMPPNSSLSKRKERLAAFGKAIGPILKAGIYIPGTDMNCGLEDIKEIYKAAGIKAKFSEFKDISHIYTAWTVIESIIAIAENRGIALKNKTAAIDGFGKVGGECAKLLSEKGVRIVAISTLEGAIFSEKGFDAKELNSLKEKYADKLLDHLEGKKIERVKIFSLGVDILIPAASIQCIDSNAKAMIISCAANSPMDDDVYEKLHKKGIIVIPDAVANCGGVFGSSMERYIDNDEIRKIIETDYRKAIKDLDAKSQTTGKSLRKLSLEIIEQRLKIANKISFEGFVCDTLKVNTTRLSNKLKGMGETKFAFRNLIGL